MIRERVICLVACLLALASLSSCGAQAGQPQPSAGQAETASVQSAPTATAAPTGGAEKTPSATAVPEPAPDQNAGGAATSPLATDGAADTSSLATDSGAATSPLATANGGEGALELVVLHTNDNWGETEPCG